MTSSAAVLRTPRASARLVDVAVVLGGVVVVGSLAVALALHLANEGNPLAPGVTDWWLMGVVGGLAFGGAGLGLAHARPRLRIGWLLAAIGIVLALSCAALEYSVREFGREAAGGATTLLVTASFWFANWAWATCLISVAAVVPLLLPEGQLPSPWWRPALVLSVLAVVGNTVQWMLTPYSSLTPAVAAAGVVNPTGTSWAGDARVGGVLLVLTVAAVASAFASIVVRWRGAGTQGRQQLKWIALGTVGGIVLFALGFALGPIVTALALVPLPAACLVAALRHGLWDVDVVISRSLVYAALMAVVLGVYAGVVALLGGVLGVTTGAPIVATAAVAVLALPLHRRLAGLVNRLVHGEPEEPFAVLRRLGERLEAAQDDATLAEQVLPDVLAAVARTLRLPYVAVQLADGTEVARGRRPAEVTQLPLVYAGTDVGRLVVADARGGPDAAILTALAEQAAVAVHTVVLARDVRRSREAAVTAREEERRRLYRDLHDGLGPSLAALALQVETARDLVDADGDAARAERARALLDRIGAHLKQTVTDVRGVVHGLRPPALDDLGLPGAVRELAGRFTGGMRVDVSVATGGELPAAVEVAAYGIVAEGLANAARHARATAARVRVERLAGSLVVTVADDGCGIPVDARPGVGLVSMRRRAEELGGTFEVAAGTQLIGDGTGRGTTVTAVLPFEAAGTGQEERAG